MLRVAIRADDLTGALDSAEPFARTGSSVGVATSRQAAARVSFEACEAVAVNVGSRDLQPDAAARAVEEAWRHLARWRPDCLFKKVDSRMKGNVVAEVAALTGVSGRSRAIMAPGIPSIGRVVAGGAVHGFGMDRPISITGLPGWMKEWDVPDCRDDSAMAAIARQVIAQRATTLAVGASGLAEAMAAALLPGVADGSTLAPCFKAGTPRMIMAIGSRDPITLEQIAALQGSDIACDTIAGCPAHRTINGSDVILLRPSSADQAPHVAASKLAARTLAVAREERISTVLLSGGDTAAAFVRLAGVDFLTPLGRLAQGMPVSRGQSVHGEFALITKSGGFGSRGTLIDAARQWRSQFQR